MKTDKRELKVILIIGLTLIIGMSTVIQAAIMSSITITSTGIITNQSVSWLSTSGSFIYNETGSKVTLHSANIQYGGQSQHFGLSDFRALKALGFNTVRLGIYWGLAQPYNETSNGIDTTYFSTAKEPLGYSIDEEVNFAEQEGMYVNFVLCWTDTWTPPSWAFPGITGDYRFATIINGSAAGERTGYINTWKFIADRYKNVPNVIFEFMNEPALPQGQEALAGNAYKTFNEEIISGIESVETTSHLKIVELIGNTPAWEEILDQAVDVNKPNVLWANHMYAPMGNWDPSAMLWVSTPFVWNGQQISAGQQNQSTYVAWRLIRIADKIHSWNKPWINTEFGKVVIQTNWDVWLDLVLRTQRDYNITGWALHTYCTDRNIDASYNIYNNNTRQLIMPVITPYMTQ